MTALSSPASMVVVVVVVVIVLVMAAATASGIQKNSALRLTKPPGKAPRRHHELSSSPDNAKPIHLPQQP